MLSILELFGGIGGFSYGVERVIGKENYKIVGYYDINEYATAVFNYNFDTKFEPIDIKEVRNNEIPKHNLLCAGFPCQAFSIAGKRRGFKDTRGTLFFEIARILEAKKPAYFILENVRGLLSVEKGKTFKVILEILEELGYEYQWMVLNSRFFGVPQNRERVFIIGNLRKYCRPEILPFKYSRYQAKEKLKIANHRLIVHSLQPRSPNRPSLQYSRGGSGYLSRTDEITYCLNTKASQAIEINGKFRKLTPIECERLQGFPDNWTKYGYFVSEDRVREISDTQRYKMLGNAVTTTVISSITNQLVHSTSIINNLNVSKKSRLYGGDVDEEV